MTATNGTGRVVRVVERASQCHPRPNGREVSGHQHGGARPAAGPIDRLSWRTNVNPHASAATDAPHRRIAEGVVTLIARRLLDHEAVRTALIQS